MHIAFRYVTTKAKQIPLFPAISIVLILLLAGISLYLYCELLALEEEFHDFQSAVQQNAYSLHIDNLESQVYRQGIRLDEIDQELWNLDERTNDLQFRVLQNEWDLSKNTYP